MTTNTNIDAATTAATLTAKGREFMRAVGNGEFSFFDGGIVAGEGSWGSVMSGEHFTSARSASGVMNGSKKAGLWTVTDDSADGPEAGSWWALTEAGAAVALHLAGATAALPAEDQSTHKDVGDRYEDPALEVVETQAVTDSAHSCVPVEQPDATKEWHGNYNTVFAPVAAEVAAAFPETTVWIENASAMLRKTHAAGLGAADFVAQLEKLEADALAALRAWQKVNAESRRDLTDMEKYNQHRAFLSGFGQAVAAKLAGKKVTRRPVAFAKDMEKAMANAEQALAQGVAAGKLSMKDAH